MEVNAPATKMTHRFAYKVMACAFCGIHVPLIGMMIYFFSISGTPSALRIIFAVLIFTLVATAATLVLLNRMMRPIQTGNKALHQYITTRQPQSLPKHSNDELGILFQQVEYLMFVLQKTVSERNKILEVAITSNGEFQQSIQHFVEAREAAFTLDDNMKMKIALEEVLRSAQSKLESATHILHTFGQPAPQAIPHS